MVGLAFLFLVLVAAILPELTPHADDLIHFNASRYYIYTLIGIWTIFLLEWLYRAIKFNVFHTRNQGLLGIAAVIIPPLRILLHPSTTPEYLWVPFVGWVRPSKQLRLRMESNFSGPMMIVALILLPLLAMEFIFATQIGTRRWIWDLIDLGTRVVWLAFAVEFLVMVSVAKKRLNYCKKHWVDIAIILLPLLSFMRAFRLLRLGHLAKLQSASRVYRIRGVGYRILRALMILRILESRSHRFAKKRLEHLHKTVKAKEEEIEDLQVEIRQLETHVTKVAQERAAQTPSPHESPEET